MTSQLERDLAASLDRRRVLGGMALGLGGAALGACSSRAGAQAGYLSCPATPTETRGPFPADGSNGRPRPINALAMAGIVRRDIRPSFAGMGLGWTLSICVKNATTPARPDLAFGLCWM